MIRTREALLYACAAGLLLASAVASAQQGNPDPPLEWASWISEVPLVDLSGDWAFDPDTSDPMVEEWRDRVIHYTITQSNDHIELKFEPQDGPPTLQSHRWDGLVTRSRQGQMEIRERAGWRDGGRTFFVDGRRWNYADTLASAYELVYQLGGGGTLVFTQRDEFGQTVWRFRRAR